MNNEIQSQNIDFQKSNAFFWHSVQIKLHCSKVK